MMTPYSGGRLAAFSFKLLSLRANDELHISVANDHLRVIFIIKRAENQVTTE